MKRKILLALALVFGMSVSVHAESLLRMVSDSGNVDVVGYDVVQEDGKDYLVVLLNYENTKDESAAPSWNINVSAFLDGLQMENGYLYDFSYENFKSGMKEVRPGSTLPYYVLFELEGDGLIELEVGPLFDFDNQTVSCELDLSQAGYTPSAEEAEDPGDGGEEAKEVYEQDEEENSGEADRIAELEARIADLEERVAALENQ